MKSKLPKEWIEKYPHKISIGKHLSPVLVDQTSCMYILKMNDNIHPPFLTFFALGCYPIHFGAKYYSECSLLGNDSMLGGFKVRNTLNPL